MSDSPEPRLLWVDVDPEMAEEMLERFIERNRTSSTTWVTRYARDMKAGRWLLAGDPIRVAADGTVFDGMHRLKAIIWAGRTITLPVMYDVPLEAMTVIDTGRPRLYKHVQEMRGEENVRTLAPLVRRMLLWDRGEFYIKGATGGHYAPTYQELDAYLNDHPELRDIAGIAAVKRPPIIRPTAFGVCLAIFSRISAPHADEFINAWASGINLPPGSPVLALRERLASDATRRHLGPKSGEMHIALACCAWNAFRQHRPITRVQLPKGILSDSNYPTPG